MLVTMSGKEVSYTVSHLLQYCYVNQKQKQVYIFFLIIITEAEQSGKGSICKIT